MIFSCQNNNYNHKIVFQESLASNFVSDSAFYYYQLATYYAINKKYSNALKPMIKALDFEPKNYVINKDISVIYHALGNIDLAKSHLKVCFNIDSNIAHTYNNYGLLLYDQDSDRLAIEYYNKAIILDKEFGPAYLNKALAFQQLNQLDSCCKYLDRAEDYSFNNSYVNELVIEFCN